MKKFTFVLAFTMLGINIQAQDKLTLSEAVNYALKHKSDAVNAHLDVENSEYMIDEVRANALPQPNFEGGLTYNPILQETAMEFMGESMVIARSEERRVGKE